MEYRSGRPIDPRGGKRRTPQQMSGSNHRQQSHHVTGNRFRWGIPVIEDDGTLELVSAEQRKTTRGFDRPRQATAR